ncbi:glycosyl hydrolase [Saccharicrinis aurantiacus]|uniref:glycosyl hydrolase n=1 Tax=Saccharicrinis aurantiacus TaxID=1849719 RepID=UPI0008382126|nr:glycosyl hydrolase [Saccharicrinis aurantiacus]
MKTNLHRAILMALCLFTPIIVEAQTNFKSLNYLYSVPDGKIVSGQHNDQKNYQGSSTDASYWTEEVHSITGKYPALYGCDLLFHGNSNLRWDVTYEAEKQWNNGAIINMMWHACPPNQSEPCQWDGGIMSSLTTSEWTDLLTDGGTLNTIWKQRINSIALPHLEYLKEKGVEVFWRPFHEQNQSLFWWNSGGAANTNALWQLTYNYMQNTLGLDNLIWIWNVQDIHTNFAQHNPGADFFDVATIDIYADGFSNTSYYNALVQEANDKPVAFGECFYLPKKNVISTQAKMSFFMTWAYGLYIDVNGNPTNSINDIETVYNYDEVITLEDMPGWDSYQSPNEELVLVNFEDIPYQLDAWNGTASVITNPRQQGINTSQNVGKYITPSNLAWSNCASLTFNESINYTDLDHIQMMVLAPSATEILCKLEDTSGNYSSIQTQVTPSMSSDWQIIELHFSELTEPEATNAHYNKLALFFNVHDNSGGEEWLFDNITMFKKSTNVIAPSNVKVVAQNSNSFTITWDEDTNATGGTNIFINTKDSEVNDQFIETIDAGIGSYTYQGTYGDINIESGTDYIAKIQSLPDATGNAYAEIEVNTTPTNTSFTTIEGINIYPNPFKNQLNIIASTHKIESVQISDIGGKLIIKEISTSNNEFYQIDLTNLPVGIYIATISLTNGEKITQKVVKQ